MGLDVTVYRDIPRPNKNKSEYRPSIEDPIALIASPLNCNPSPTAYNGLVGWEIVRDATESNQTPLVLSCFVQLWLPKEETTPNQYETMRLSVSNATEQSWCPRIKLLVWSGCATLSRRIR